MHALRLFLHELNGFRWAHKERVCHRVGHAWSDRTDPICCGRCGAMRTHGRWW